jgi:hypothetical protein
VQQPRSESTLNAFLASCQDIAEDEREWLNTWLTNRPDWEAVKLAGLDVRLDMIRRLCFVKPSSL